MALFNRSRTRDTADETADETGDGQADAPETKSRRRWLLVGLVVAAAALYLRSKRRAAREARFTEIELDPVDADSGAESEPSAE
jgi:hypothetical protein